MPELTSHVCTVGNLNAAEGDAPESCPDVPVALYNWPWGESGACCSKHQFILQQRAGHLGQQLTISPLNVPAAPMTRDERTQMHAKILALQDEVDELKGRAAELYQDNTKLQTEGRRLLARNNELDDQLRLLKDQTRELAQARDDMTVQRNDLRAELDRTKLLVSAPRNPPPQGSGNQPPPNTTLGTGG